MTVAGGMDRLRFTLSLPSRLVAQSLPISPWVVEGAGDAAGQPGVRMLHQWLRRHCGDGVLDEGLQVTGDNKGGSVALPRLS